MPANKIKYIAALEPTDQIDVEEQLSAMLFTHPNINLMESTANRMGKQILYEVLRRFRKDLFVDYPNASLEPNSAVGEVALPLTIFVEVDGGVATVEGVTDANDRAVPHEVDLQDHDVEGEGYEDGPPIEDSAKTTCPVCNQYVDPKARECTNEECRLCVWLIVQYKCPRCGNRWEEESGSACDAECPGCDLKAVTALSYTNKEQ